MDYLFLSAKTRSLKGKKVKTLRRQGILPAVVYGRHFPTQSLMVTQEEFIKVYEKAGESQLIDLQIDQNQSIKVLVYDLQFDPVSSRLKHIDFYQVRMTEKITTEVPLQFIKVAPAVKELGGVLVKHLDVLRVECLPEHLPRAFEVDLSQLQSFSDIIYVKDINLPSFLKVLDKEDEVITLVQPPRAEEELKPETEVKPEEKIEEITLVKKDKKEEEGER